MLHRRCPRDQSDPVGEDQPVKKLHEGKQGKASRRMPEPHVGIFWMFNGNLIIDGTPSQTVPRQPMLPLG